MTDRRSGRSWPLAASLLLGVPAAAGAQDALLPSTEQYRLRVEYREYRPTLTGLVQKGFGDTPGTELDMEDDLGIEDQRTFEVHGAIQIRQGHKLRVSYTRVDYDTNVPEARRTFLFGSTRFERFSNIVTSAKGALYTAEYEWDFFKGRHGYLGALLGVKMLDMDWLIASPPTQREADTLRAPIPSLGAAARVYAGRRLSLDGEISGLSLGSSGSAFEFQTSARLHISDRLAAQGGYRLVKIKGESGLDLGDMRLSGFTFGLELSL
jgi:hypothetical protein